MDNLELKPCPFCGEKARIEKHSFSWSPNKYGVKCCFCGAGTYPFYYTPKEAAGAWNRRSGDER